MARPKKGVTLEMRAKEALVFGEDGHWWSTLSRHESHRVSRLRVGDSRVSQLLVLWQIYLGDPVGLLSNACGRAECVNPYHYRDESDRQQADWRVGERSSRRTFDLLFDHESERFMQIIDITEMSDALIGNVYGMTNDMGCYHCSESRFDPLKHRNQVVGPECWTDEDQAKAEACSYEL